MPRPCFECGEPIGDEEPAYARIGGELRVLHESCLDVMEGLGEIDEDDEERDCLWDTRREADEAAGRA